jgi:Zn-dependent protease
MYSRRPGQASRRGALPHRRVLAVLFAAMVLFAAADCATTTIALSQPAVFYETMSVGAVLWPMAGPLGLVAGKALSIAVIAWCGRYLARCERPVDHAMAVAVLAAGAGANLWAAASNLLVLLGA